MLFLINLFYVFLFGRIDFTIVSSKVNLLNPQKEDSLLRTPIGVVPKSQVHYIDNQHYLSIFGDSIEVIKRHTNEVVQRIYNRKYKLKGLDYQNIESFHMKIEKNINGWVTYAHCQIYYPNYKPITYFSTSYTVPSPPVRKNNQLIYLFNGLSGGSHGNIAIIQPVLQWGKSPAGGGDYWSICNWYVIGMNQFFYDTLIKVNPGEKLKGIIKTEAHSDSLFKYYAFFEGYKSGLMIDNSFELNTPYEAFEAYDLHDCDEFPSDEKLRMHDITIKTNIENPPVIWYSYDDYNKPVNNCGQFTSIKNTSSQDGEIHIYFHKPIDIDGFKEIHIYPNPVINYLHVSPDLPISDCTIKIRDLSGKCLKSFYVKTLENEINLNFQDFEPGTYLIEFIYNNKNHVFKILKT